VAGAFSAAAAAAASASFLANLGPIKYALSILFVAGLVVVFLATLVGAKEDRRREKQKEARRTQPLIIDVSRVRTTRDDGQPPLIDFTLTNEAEDRVKVYSLAVRVDTRQPAPTAHVPRAGAVPVTYSAAVTVGPPGSSGEVLEQEHVLEAGETEAYNVEVRAPGGWCYQMRLVTEWAYIGEPRQQMSGPTFQIEIPAANAEELRRVLEEMRGE
jgi:hypothetical protein